MRRVERRTFLSILIAAICGISTVCFAQNTGNDEASLQGKWTYEGITAFEGNVQQPFSLDDLCCEFPKEMDIRQDGIDCVWKGRTSTAKYNDILKWGMMCVSICAEWKIVDNKLQLTWTQDIDGGEGEDLRSFNMTVTYKLN